MANNSVPKHDFAPAWLKLPGEAQKPSSGGLNGEHRERLSRRDDRPNGKSGIGVIGRHRQSSFDQQYPRRGDKRVGSGHNNHEFNNSSRQPFSSSYRHHSIDVDESQYYNGTSGGSSSSSGSSTGGGSGSGGGNSGLQDSYSVTGCYRQFGSQPSLNRRSLRESIPFNSSSSYSNNTSSHKGYSVYEFSSDNYRNSNHHSLSHGRHHRGFESRSSNSTPNNKELLSPETTKENSADRFNQEFPSLKGDSSDSGAPPVSINGGVWADNVRNAKVYQNKLNDKLQITDKKLDGADLRSGSPGSMTSNGGSSPKPNTTPIPLVKTTVSQNLSNSMYRSLVPSKGTITRKPSKETFRISSPVVPKPSRQSSPTPPPLEILNTRLVTHPRNLGNKSDFLKTLRNESVDNDTTTTNKETRTITSTTTTTTTTTTKQQQQQHEPKVRQEEERGGKKNDGITKDTDTIGNGTDKMKDDGKKPNLTDKDTTNENKFEVNGIRCRRLNDEQLMEKPVLSSSLEEEQRLLREMGWKEEESGDEDVYAPLTEDEMKEFETLSKKIIQQKNGLQRNVQLPWSPKRLIPPFNNTTTCGMILPPDDDDDTCSTSSSDSDDFD